MYDAVSYGRMLADSSRIEYVRALEATVRPGSVVLDIGTGLGFFALIACQLGARRVFAVEGDPIVEAARELVEANGYGDRVECIQALSTEIDLPEQADIIVADLRGILPWYGTNIDSIADARERFLAPGGRLIPQRDTLRAALVEAQGSYEDRFAVWDSGLHGLDLEAGRPLAVNQFWRERVTHDQLITDVATGPTIDYTKDSEPDMQCALEWSAESDGSAHGLALWFDSVLADGAGFSTGPHASKGVYGSAFFPLQHPVLLQPGDKIKVDLAARWFDGTYVWRWRTRVWGPGGSKADFRQSTILGIGLSANDVARRSRAHQPSLAGEGAVALAVLQRFDGGTSIEDIAKEIQERFPGVLGDPDKALARVVRLAERFGS